MIIKEGKAVVYEYLENIPTKKSIVFYNPDRKCERDLNVEINKILFNDYECLDLLAASGIRGIRLYLETNCNYVVFNDISKEAIKLIEKNVKMNNIENYRIYNYDSRALPYLINEKFRYIDIDPFGSAINYLYPTTQILAKKSIVSVTYTDVGVLMGKYKSKAKIRYFMDLEKKDHEYGIRNAITIVIRELIRENFLPIPIFSFHEKHYYRIYFKVLKVGSGKIRKFLEENVNLNYKGKLWDKDLIKKLSKINFECNWINRMIKILDKEIDVEGNIYNIHELAKKYKIKQMKKIDEIIKELEELGYKASRTIFNNYSIRTNAPLEIILKIMPGAGFEPARG